MHRFRLHTYRLSEKGTRKALGDLEADIMEICWRQETAKVSDIHKELEQQREIAYTTVMTVMSRLADKGILIKERVGKHYIYEPAVDKEEFHYAVFRAIIGGITAELGARALPFFVDYLTHNEEALGELEQLVRQKRREGI